jgi:hypothetical protein
MTITFPVTIDQLDRIEKGQTKIMAAIDDLKTNVTRLSASSSAMFGSAATELKAIADLLAKPNTTDTDIASAAVTIRGVADKMDATATSLDAETAVITGTPPAAGGPPAG